MFALLFNRERAEMYRLDLLDEGGDFEHLAGGDVEYEGAVPPGCKKSVHLFFSLDLSDPRVGVQLPDVDSLPIFYALGNVGGPFRYRVLPGGFEIQMFSQPYPKKWRASILKDYPEPFPPCMFDLVPTGYDPKDLTALYFYGGLLGVAALSDRQKAAVKKKYEKWYFKKWGEEALEDYDAEKPYETLEALVAGCTPFTQGMPEEKCPNPECENHKQGVPLPVLLYIEPDKGDVFYKAVAGGDSGQLVFQFCAKCGSVVATNPCT